MRPDKSNNVQRWDTNLFPNFLAASIQLSVLARPTKHPTFKHSGSHLHSRQCFEAFEAKTHIYGVSEPSRSNSELAVSGKDSESAASHEPL